MITGEAMSITPLVCKPAELLERLDGLATQGITEVAFQPTGDVTRERTAFALHLYTGQRRADVARMAWTDVAGNAINVVQAKTGNCHLWGAVWCLPKCSNCRRASAVTARRVNCVRA